MDSDSNLDSDSDLDAESNSDLDADSDSDLWEAYFPKTHQSQELQLAKPSELGRGSYDSRHQAKLDARNLGWTEDGMQHMLVSGSRYYARSKRENVGLDDDRRAELWDYVAPSTKADPAFRNVWYDFIEVSKGTLNVALR